MPEPDDFSKTPEANEMLLRAMEELYDHNQELAIRMKEELDAAARGEENILLVGTDGDFTVTILYVDPEFTGGKKGIMLLPSSSSVSILAAVDREFIEDKIKMCEVIEESGDGASADQMWDDFMSDLMKAAVEEHRKNPRTF
jgi:hypothetical protein